MTHPTPTLSWTRQLAAFVLAPLCMLWAASAAAVPSYARQTGMECSACHVGSFGPQLTPTGIRFKIGGYVDTDGKDGKIPLSGMVVASATRTRGDQVPAPDHLKANNNVTLDEASLFLAGRLASELGIFVQATHNGIDHSTALDQADVRWAHTMPLMGKEATIGISVNNNPGLQDPFNTLPAWSFPYVGPEAAFGTGDAASLLNGGLAQRVIGASAYAFWNSSVYAELGSYRSLSPTLQSRLGEGRDAQRLGANAYGRLAYFRDMKAQNFSVGVFGWDARLAPDREPTTPQNRYRDFGADASYQFLGTREHIATLYASHLRERSTAGDTGESGRLSESRFNASYYFQNTWGATLGLFDTRGTDPAAATRGQLLQFDWTPWGKEDLTAPFPFGWANLRLGVQVWRYGRFGGDSAAARDHDTLHLFAWTSF